MIDIDAEAQAQLAQRRRRPSRRNAALRTQAVEEAMRTKLQGQVYRKYGVSGSTFYFWRCEYVVRRHAERLEQQIVALRAELALAQAHNRQLREQLDHRPVRQPLRLERLHDDTDRRLDALERQIRLVTERQVAHAG